MDRIKLTGLAVVLIMSLFLVGCQGADAPPETKEVREAFTNKEAFDINNVPPEHQAAVRARLGMPPADGAAPAAPGAPAPSGGGAPTPPAPSGGGQ